MAMENEKNHEESLLALRDQLSHEIKDIIRGGELGEDSDQADIEADESEERGIANAEAIALKDRLHSVLDALERVKAGTYGVCEGCKGVIGADVLEAAPESRLCKACKADKR